MQVHAKAKKMDSKQYKVGILGSGRMGGTVAMPYAVNDLKAKEIVAQLITDSGFDPFDVGDTANGKLLDLPMGEGSLNGEE